MVTSPRNVMDTLDQEEQKAAQRASGSFVPLFLPLKDKQKALVRPLVNFDQMLVLAMHNKFNQASPKDSVNAVCASEIEEDCLLCHHAKDDRKLGANMSFFLPVWLYSLKQQKKNEQGVIVKDSYGSPVWEEVTYEDSDGNKKAVQGFRVLELKRMGTINDVLQFFRKFYSDPEYGHTITDRDFIVERVGGDQKTTYTTLPQAPKPMTDEVKGAIPTIDELRSKILEKCPPVSNATTPVQGKSESESSAVSAEDEGFLRMTDDIKKSSVEEIKNVIAFGVFDLGQLVLRKGVVISLQGRVFSLVDSNELKSTKYHGQFIQSMSTISLEESCHEIWQEEFGWMGK